MPTTPPPDNPATMLRAALRAQLAASPVTIATRRGRQHARDNLDRKPHWRRWQYRGWPQPGQEHG
jgi:hypothetical protein